MSNNGFQPAKELEEYVEVQADLHTYKLVIPKPLFVTLQTVSKQEHMTVLELIKRYLKMGLIIDEIQRTPGTKLIVQQPGEPDERLRLI